MSNSQTINNVTTEILRAVEELKKGSGFGSIEILVHDGRVTQIEKREKQRFVPGKSGSDQQITSTSLSHINSAATK